MCAKFMEISGNQICQKFIVATSVSSNIVAPQAKVIPYDISAFPKTKIWKSPWWSVGLVEHRVRPMRYLEEKFRFHRHPYPMPFVRQTGCTVASKRDVSTPLEICAISTLKICRSLSTIYRTFRTGLIRSRFSVYNRRWENYEHRGNLAWRSLVWSLPPQANIPTKKTFLENILISPLVNKLSKER